MPTKSQPHISARDYIRWPPGDAFENTNTIVVTSADGRFVDIRARIMDPAVANLMPPGIQPAAATEWAFAGLSTNEIIQHPDGTSIMHCKWHHLIDSLHPEADKVKDEGDMFPLGDGKSLEKGKMVNPFNPAAGEQSYEEGWRDVSILSQRKDGKVEMAVLQLMEDEVGARGMVVRVGQFVQGILRVRNEYALERWVWTKKAGWKRELRDGSLWLPTGVAMDLGTIELGDDLQFRDFPWKVVELGIGD